MSGGLKLAGIVTLATPFTVAHERNLGESGTVVSQSLVIWLVLGLYWFAASWLGQRFGSTPDGELSIGYKIALIVRAVADEATAAITFLQFPSTLATVVFGHLAGATDSVVHWCERLARRPLLAIGGSVLFLIASMVPAGLVLWLTDSELLMWVALIAFVCLSYGPIVFLILRNPALARVTAAGVLALPLAPATILIGVAAAIAYGSRFALANLDLDISVESTPVGEYQLTLL